MILASLPLFTSHLTSNLNCMASTYMRHAVSLWAAGLVLAVSLLICGNKVLGEPDEVDHCTAIGIGRKATASGATMIAHTDDRWGLRPRGGLA